MLTTECSQESFRFAGLSAREVVGRFDGRRHQQRWWGLLLREVEGRLRIMERFADCFTDHRSADRIEHSVAAMLAQRVCGLALGYEDLNDHDQLRADPLLAVLAGVRDPTGEDRKQERIAAKGWRARAR